MVNMFLPKLNLIELIDLPDENTSQAVWEVWLQLGWLQSRKKLGAMCKDVEIEALLVDEFSDGQTEGGKPLCCP